jgi:hypothetical protein
MGCSRQPFLTQKLCELIRTDDKSLSIEEIVQTRVIENWESQDEPEHLKTIRDRILRDKQSSSALLGLYQQILKQADITSDNTYAQMQLQLSGLVIKRQHKLEIYNKIYRKVFDENWVKKELAESRPQFYKTEITAWLESHRQDESRLLRGKLLKQAEEWALGKNLSSEDRDFLDASRALYNQELEKAVGPTNLKFGQEEASSLLDLIYMCDKYHSIAQNYLFNGYLEEWLFLRSQTDLANLSRNIVRSYEQQKARGLEIFVRALCKQLKPNLYPKIFFDPLALKFDEAIPIGLQKRFSFIIGNNGRGFAWGDVIDPNLPGLIIPQQFDSSNKTFDIQLDTLEVQPGNYQGDISILLKGLEYACRIPINYKVRENNFIIDPPEINLGVISHSEQYIDVSLRITSESPEVRIKGTASTNRSYLEVSPSSFEDSSFELSLTLDTNSLEAGKYNTELDVIINTRKFQVPIYFRKSLRWDVINKFTASIGFLVGLCMGYIRYDVGNSLSVDFSKYWILSYPSEVSRTNLFRLINPLKISESVPEIQLIYAKFGIVFISIISFLIWLNFRSYFGDLKELLRRSIETLQNLVNEFKENLIRIIFIRNEHQLYSYSLGYSRNTRKTFISWLLKLVTFSLILEVTLNLLIIIFAWIGSSFIVIIDLTAHPLRIFNVKNPVCAWFILGYSIGGVLGLIQALKLIKQYSYLSKVYKISLIITLILFLVGYLTA